MERRSFLQAAAGATAGSMLPVAWWREMVFAATPARPGPSPYGPLQSADANGIELPAGFTSRVVATTGQPVGATSYRWHSAPDGGGCVADGTGGWVYASNAEITSRGGGASAIRFNAAGGVVDAYRILADTSWNCAGGMTPWSTWLSCEESGSQGKVFECDPFRSGQGVMRPLLGSFNHEAAAVDPATGHVYLTEDHASGRFYKFVPRSRGDLSAGALYAATVDGAGRVGWVQTRSDTPDRNPATAVFAGGEGIFIGAGVIYFATKLDKRVWELDLATSIVAVAYDCLAHPEGALNAVDNLTIHPSTGRVFIGEDGGNMEVGVLSGSGSNRTVAAMCRLHGNPGSEIAGLAFSPDGTRLYFSSQREINDSVGVTFEITGPFGRDGSSRQPVALSVANGTYVRGGSFGATSFGSAWALEVCNNATDEHSRRTLLSTPISSVAGPYERAVLRVAAWMWKGGPATMDVHAVGSTWDPRTTTWNTQPAIGALVGQFVVASTAAAWYEIDVTNHLNALHAARASVVSFSVRQVTLNGPVGYVQGPGANVNRPELVLTPTTSATTPSAPRPTTPPPPTTARPSTPPTTARPSTPPTTVAPTPSLRTTIKINIANDSYTRGGSNETKNYASSRLLQVCNNSTQKYERWGHLSAPIPQIPRKVRSATLRVNMRMSSGGQSKMSVSRTAAGWKANTLTWANQPVPGKDADAVFTVKDKRSRWYDIDVTSIIEDLRVAGGREMSVVIRQAQRNGKVAYVNASNHWTKDRPQLIITY